MRALFRRPSILRRAWLLGPLALWMSSAVGAESQIDVISAQARTTDPGAAAYFSGQVQVEQLFGAQADRSVSGGRVTFQPGARSAWHTHPKGQILIVTAGTGLVQQWGKPAQIINLGDVVWIPPGIKHWHGAAPFTSMTHLAIQDVADGKAVDWMEPVGDEQYSRAAAGVSTSTATAPHSFSGGSMLPQHDIDSVSPGLAAYTDGTLLGEVWKRPGLSARDRSIVTVSALIARNQTARMSHYLGLALDNGVKPGELSEIITHLAFYSGWENAMSTAAAAAEVFQQRGIGADQLPPAKAQLLPLNEAAEKQRAATVEQNFGSVAPGVVRYTTDTLFRDLWLRPALAPRDRSLVTVSALIASGQVAQVAYHLNRAMDNGLTQAQVSEVLTQLAFYAGWPNVFSALPVVKDVFEKRPK
jgi:4-carboxymuconolactone decarboxylase